MDMDVSDKLGREFLDVMENRLITTVFQPIVSLRDGSVFGYEALSRGPEDSPLRSPAALFDCAKRFNMLWELEWLCRVTAIETVLKVKLQSKIFLNVNPKIMHDPKFRQGFTREYLGKYRLDPERIVFEITEKGVIGDFQDFIKTVENYKEQNFKIAIDDAGAGYSGLNMISDINPHFIKLDMHLIRDIDKDFTRQSLVRSFTEFASLTNTRLIAEGIETKGELAKLIDIGVHYGQGYYIARPEAAIAPISPEVLQTINDANFKRNHLAVRKFGELYVSNITASQPAFSPAMNTMQIYEYLQKDRSLPGVCVVEDGEVRGVVTRDELYKRLSGQYGYTLFSKKPVSAVMSTSFLQVDASESIESVSKKAMARGYENLYDFITVTRDGKYLGIVTVKDLLEKSFQAELYNAIHLNPLSRLPGNVLIESELEKCIDCPYEYTVLYFDINNFKAYNDVYGFENGDRLLKCFTQILKSLIPQDRFFLGHIGGDDFMAIVSDMDVERLCSSVISEFDEAARLFYSINDLDRGYIIARNRHGIEEVFPMLSLSIAAVSNRGFNSVTALSERMAELKKTCKQRPGSNYILG